MAKDKGGVVNKKRLKRKAVLNFDMDSPAASLGFKRKKVKKMKRSQDQDAGDGNNGLAEPPKDQGKGMVVDIEAARPMKSQSRKIIAALTTKKKKHASDRKRQRAIDKKQRAQDVNEDPFDVPEFETIEIVDLEPSDQSDNEVEVQVDESNEADELEEAGVSGSASNRLDNSSANPVDMMDDDALDFLELFENGISYKKLSNTRLLVHQRPSATLTFTGKARIYVLHGVIEIGGHKLHKQSKPCEVYCPQPSHLLSVQGVPRGDDAHEGGSHLIELDNNSNENGERKAILRIFRGALNKAQLQRLENAGGATLVLEGFETEWSLKFRNLLQKQARHVLGDKMAAVAVENSEEVNYENDEELGDSTFDDPFEGLGLTLYSQPQEDSELHAKLCSEWNQVFGDIISSGDLVRIGVFGGQNSGKSTLTKWFTNKLLNQAQAVLYLDLDPGQPEFTPPGMISAVLCETPILGPNYTHLAHQPIRSIFLGSTNVADSPVSYWNAVRQLWNFINRDKDLKNIPWVVNTMGFARGLGVDLACEIIKTLQLKSVIQLDLNREKSDYPFDLSLPAVTNYRTCFVRSPDLEGTDRGTGTVENGEERETNTARATPKGPKLNYRFYKINSVHYRNRAEMSNVDEEGHAETDAVSQVLLSGPDRKLQREHTILSYFAPVLTTADGINGLETVVPYIVPLNAIKVGLENLHPLPSNDSILRTMNANLVALCNVYSNNTDSGKQGEANAKFIQYKNSDDISCIGYGFVRAVDIRQDLLYILTPIPPDVLQQNVNCIVPAGSIGVPVQLCSFGQGRVQAHARSGGVQGPDDAETPYIMNPRKHRINSRLHSVTKKFFVPNRVAAHNVLRKCLL